PAPHGCRAACPRAARRSAGRANPTAPARASTWSSGTRCSPAPGRASPRGAPPGSARSGRAERRTCGDPPPGARRAPLRIGGDVPRRILSICPSPLPPATDYATRPPIDAASAPGLLCGDPACPSPRPEAPMVLRPLRQLNPAEEAVELYDEWLAEIDAALARGDDRWELCRRTLTQLFYPGLAGVDPATLPIATRVALAQMDARNVTLEPEYYSEIDTERFTERKPLIWLWQMFDRTPLGANIHL